MYMHLCMHGLLSFLSFPLPCLSPSSPDPSQCIPFLPHIPCCSSPHLPFSLCISGIISNNPIFSSISPSSMYYPFRVYIYSTYAHFVFISLITTIIHELLCTIHQKYNTSTLKNAAHPQINTCTTKMLVIIFFVQLEFRLFKLILSHINHL